METNWRAAGDAAPPAGDDSVALSAIYINIKYIFVCMFVVNRSLCASLLCFILLQFSYTHENTQHAQLVGLALVTFLKQQQKHKQKLSQLFLPRQFCFFFFSCQQSQLVFTNFFNSLFVVIPQAPCSACRCFWPMKTSSTSFMLLVWFVCLFVSVSE